MITIINKLWNNKFYYKAASCWNFYWVIYDARIHEYQISYPIFTSLLVYQRVGWTAELWPQDGRRRDSNPWQRYFRDGSGEVMWHNGNDAVADERWAFLREARDAEERHGPQQDDHVARVEGQGTSHRKYVALWVLHKNAEKKRNGIRACSWWELEAEDVEWNRMMNCNYTNDLKPI